MKKYKWLIILLAVIIGLVVIAFVFSEDEGKYIKEANIDKVLSMKENGETFILYVKQTDCQHCKVFTPRFVSALKETKLKAYSINLTDIGEDDREKFDKNFEVDGTPTVLFIIEGNTSMITVEGEQSKDRIVEKIKSVDITK